MNKVNIPRPSKTKNTESPLTLVAMQFPNAALNVDKEVNPESRLVVWWCYCASVSVGDWIQVQEAPGGKAGSGFLTMLKLCLLFRSGVEPGEGRWIVGIDVLFESSPNS